MLNLAGLIEHNGDQGCQFESEEIKSEPTKRKGKANSKKTAVDAVSQTTSISTLPSSQNNIIDLFDGLSVGSSANNHTSDQSLSLLLPAEKPSPTQKPNEVSNKEIKNDANLIDNVIIRLLWISLPLQQVII